MNKKRLWVVVAIVGLLVVVVEIVATGATSNQSLGRFVGPTAIVFTLVSGGLWFRFGPAYPQTRIPVDPKDEDDESSSDASSTHSNS